MPRLPVLNANEELNTGSQFMRTIDAPTDTARALGGLGNAVGQLGAAFEAERQRSKANVDRVEASQALMNIATFERAETDRLRQAAEDPNITPANLHKNFMEEHQKRLENLYNGLNDDLKTKLGPQLANSINEFDNRAYQLEQQKTAKVMGDALKVTAETASEGVLSGRDPSEVRLQTYAAIDALNLPETRVAEARKIADKGIDEAWARRFIAENPAAAEKELRDQVLGVPTDLTPTFRTSYDTAQRYGHDPKLMLMIELAESGGDPTKTTHINPKTGRPYSTAYGKFQFLDGDWAETGIPKTSDPGLQAEAMARRMTFLKNTLERRGLELNPQSVYGAHFLGRNGFTHVATADPNANFAETYAKVAGRNTAAQALAGNARLLGDGSLTNAQVLANIGNHANRRMSEAEKMLAKREGFDANAPAIVNGVQLAATSRAELASLFQEAQKRQSESVAVEAKAVEETQLAAIKAGQGVTVANAYDDNYRKLVNKAAESTQLQTRLLSDDPTERQDAIGETMAQADSDGFIPEAASNAVQAMLRSPDPEMKQRGYQLAARVHAADPINGLDHSGIRGENAADVKRYVDWISRGQPEDGAIARVEKERENVKRNVSTDFTNAVKEERGKRTWAEIENIDFTRAGLPGMKEGFGNPFKTNVDRSPTDSYTRELLVEIYRDNFEFHMKSGVSLEQATASAQRDVRDAFGQTKILGKDQLTLFPPEKIYPPDKSTPNAPHAYVERQAMETAEAYAAAYNRANPGREIEFTKDRVLLRPTGQTMADYAARVSGRADKLPKMQLVMIDQNGTTHGYLDFVADPRLEAIRTPEAKAEPVPQKATGALLREARAKAEAEEAAARAEFTDRLRAIRGEVPPN